MYPKPCHALSKLPANVKRQRVVWTIKRTISGLKFQNKVSLFENTNKITRFNIHRKQIKVWHLPVIHM